MNNDSNLKTAVAGRFGSCIFRESGELDKRKLAEIVFNDKEALEILNKMVHPAVARDFERWRTQQKSYYVIEETAIIYESGIADRFDKIIAVSAPEEIRIARVCFRESVTPEIVRERMANQAPEEMKIKLANYVIYNDNTRMIIPQVMEIHRQITGA